MSSEGRRIALVLGNAAYPGSPLKNPANDAQDLASSLTRIGFSGIDSVEVSVRLDLDYNGLRETLGGFAEATHGAKQAVLYYAGHGIEYQGDNYLIPVDARLQHAARLDFEAAPLVQILRNVDEEGGLRLIILDACRNNPFRSRLFGGRDAGRGLRAVEPKGSILVAYAAKHGTVAQDGGDERNSPFASSLLAHVEKPGIEVVQLFREVRSDVLDRTGREQEPFLYGSLGRHQEYLVPPVTAAPVSVPSFAGVDAATREHTLWTSISALTDPLLFEDFLSKFPDGTFSRIAEARFESCVAACTSVRLIEKFIASYRESPRLQIVTERLAELKPSAPSVKTSPPFAPNAPPEDPARLPDFATFRDRFADGSEGPEMVVIPAGSFLMGSALGEDQLGEDDKAQEDEIVPGQGKRRMRIARRFALGRYPVTFAEHDAFCAATGAERPDDKGWGRERRPVINISWKDAIAYIDWLNAQLSLSSDKGYRLPSESEWEYCCRAGTDTRRWWGDDWDPAKANGAGSFGVLRTSPVDHFGPNAWGLHDMIGNVFEWCADVWADNIAELPEDGGTPYAESADAVFSSRVLRGGSWYLIPRDLRSASRGRSEPGDRGDAVGFRLSRTL